MSQTSDSVDHQRMRECLLKEAETLIGSSYVTTVPSIFFGGGTPSLAPASTLEAVISLAGQVAFLPGDAEVTLEANPTSTESKKLRDFRLAGVNRVSIGLQALDDKDLRVLGRQHSVQEGLRCLEEARRIFPGRTSVDLIFGRPGQTLEAWRKELKQLLSLCDEHVSLYQLTLERGTSLFKQSIEGTLTLPDADQQADIYECAVQMLEKAGYKRYEVSNFAKEGAESSHNKSYWRGAQYIGIGPGAHGRFVRCPSADVRGSHRWAFTQTLEPGPWMAEVEKYGHATRRAVQQTPYQVLEELLMLALRTSEGLHEKRWRELGGMVSLEDLFGSDPHSQLFIQKGFLKLDKHGLVATQRGLNVIDSITPVLLCRLEEKLGEDRETKHTPS